MPDHDIAKLPKWAQTRIRKLEADLASMDRKLSLMTKGETEVAMLGYARDSAQRQDTYLPPGSIIVFRLGNGREIHAKVRPLGKHRQVLELHASGSRHRLNITPWSSNVAIVANEEIEDLVDGFDLELAKMQGEVSRAGEVSSAGRDL